MWLLSNCGVINSSAIFFFSLIKSCMFMTPFLQAYFLPYAGWLWNIRSFLSVLCMITIKWSEIEAEVILKPESSVDKFKTYIFLRLALWHHGLSWWCLKHWHPIKFLLLHPWKQQMSSGLGLLHSRGSSDDTPDSWLCPDSVRANVVICRVDLWMENSFSVILPHNQWAFKR